MRARQSIERTQSESIPAGDAPVYLIRHAKAGDRQQWTEDDRLRPLSRTGLAQAEGLVPAFRGKEVAGITSSPYVRCIQTVRPLALDRALAIDVSDALAEGAPTSSAVELVERSPAGTVLCSHGDVISAVVRALSESGMSIEGSDGWKKGSTWMLDRSLGRFVRARYIPPPAIG